ncbi:MAG: glutamate-5-semialdehyde dehydrogenase, partial [Clostridia bacterium]
MFDLIETCKAAKKASRFMLTAGTAEKNAALLTIADALEKSCGDILSANEKDVAAARAKGTRESMIDRLSLNENRVKAMADGLRQVAALPDPVGRFDSVVTRPNGLYIGKKRVPLGVIGIIYEARPNVTADAAALCLKSGNVCVLRGGSEAVNSNMAISEVMRKAAAQAGFPEDVICFVSDTSRETAAEMMRQNKYIDVLIPRGGAGLIRTVVETASVPVIETGTGNCHVYIDDFADLKMGAEIIYNAKCSRPSVCNAAESLVVARSVAKEFLPMAKARLDEKNVEIRGDEETRAILGDSVVPATDEDYYTEFLDYILSVKVVENIDEAVEFINEH